MNMRLLNRTEPDLPIGIATGSARKRSADAPAGGERPFAFMLQHVRRHAPAHLVVLGSVVTAVAFAVGSQYAIKHLVDVLSAHRVEAVWWAFALLAGVIAAD